MKPAVLFSIPCTFEGEKNVHQRNAIRSWLLLRPRPRVLLVGNDAGVAEAAKELGVEHVPLTADALTESGTPLYSGAYRAVLKESTEPLVMHVSADMVIAGGLMGAVAMVSARFDRFFLGTLRWDLRCPNELEFGRGWERRVVSAAMRQNPKRWRHPKCVDVWVWSRESLEEFPDYVVGRSSVDEWMIYDFRRRGIPVVDASGVVNAVHMVHSRAYVDDEVRKGEIRHNRGLEVALGMRGSKDAPTRQPPFQRAAGWVLTLEEGLRQRPTKAEARVGREKGGGCKGCGK